MIMPVSLDRIDEFRTEPSRFLEEPEEEEHSLKGLPPLSFSVQETRAEMHRRLYQAMRSGVVRNANEVLYMPRRTQD